MLIGYYIPDFVVEEKIIVELKALERLDNTHFSQVISYLAESGLPIGLLINFGTCSLQYKRVLPPSKINEHRINYHWLFIPDRLKNKNEQSVGGLSALPSPKITSKLSAQSVPIIR